MYPGLAVRPSPVLRALITALYIPIFAISLGTVDVLFDWFGLADGLLIVDCANSLAV